jgi:hypothetical protein
MKTVQVHSHCGVCGWGVTWELDVFEHGFFQVPDGFCPNDFCLLIQDILGHIRDITDEVEDES